MCGSLPAVPAVTMAGTADPKPRGRARHAAAALRVCDHGSTMMNPKKQRGTVIVVAVLFALLLVVSLVLAPGSA